VDDDIVQQNAGSPELSASGASPGMTEQEYSLLLNPYESDGPDDTQKWNLFDPFLVTNEASLDDRHDLSRMLKNWEDHSVSLILFELLVVSCPIPFNVRLLLIHSDTARC